MISKLIYILRFLWDRQIPFLKKFNFILIFAERFITRNKKLLSRPYLYIIEATTACNLKCVKCVHAQGNAINIGNLTYANFETIFNKIKEYAIVIGFVNWGEAFLNKDIFKMIRRCVDNKVKVDLSTNLNFKSQELLEQIVESGIDYLTISIDGVTQHTYGQYRVGGDIRLVLGNIRYLQDYKERINARVPKIFWQFLVTRYNENEIEYAKEVAAELGVSIFFNKFRPTMHREVFMSDAEKCEDLRDWFPQKSNISYQNILNSGKKRRCLNPWLMCVINFDGGVYPCCSLSGERHYFGNVLDDGFARIWNNDKFSLARKIILGKNNEAFKDPPVCSICKDNNFTLY